MDTIKAKDFYRVVGIKKDGELYAIASWNYSDEECLHLRAVLDGNSLIMVACLISWEDFLQEREQNECFHFCEQFTTRKGSHYIYWRDEESGLDYITKIC